MEDSNFKNNNTSDVQENKLPESLYDYTDNKVHSFIRLSDKYKDITSSALTMLIVGIVGIIFMILVFADIIPLPINASTAWLFDSVMGGIFIIFIIAGIVSFMHAKQVKIDAEAEDKLDEGLDLREPEEILYFSRADKIKDLLMHQFENADEALIYEYTEQIYQNIYE